jgi:anti-anti-sigma factor
LELIEKEKKNNTMVLSVAGRLDAVSAPEFESQVSGFIDQGEMQFVVDFQGLEYISSAGLRAILSPAKKLKAVKGSLVLANLTGSVKKVFEISGISTIIPLFDSVNEAMASFK